MHQTPTPDRRHRRPLLKATKIVLWTAEAVLLTFLAAVMCMVHVLTSDRLAPVVEDIGNDMLVNARLEIDTIDLSMVSTFPFVNADVRGLRIISTVTQGLDADTRDGLPAYTDTVATVGRFTGGVDILALLDNTVRLSNVTIDRPAANLVVIDDESTNFNIIRPDTTVSKPFDWKDLPQITLERLEVTNPGLIRYYDATDGTDMSLSFTRVNFTGTDAPLYTLNVDGDINAPILMDYFSLDDLGFGLNGTIRWSQAMPSRLALKDFRFKASLIEGLVTTDMDFADGLVFNTLDLDLSPISVDKVLHIVPDEMAEDLDIPTDIVTTAMVGIKARLDAPYDVTSESLPRMTATLDIPDCTLQWQDLDLKTLGAHLTLTVPDDNPDDARLTIDRLQLKGPATDLDIKGTLTNLFTDPVFDGTCDGTCDMKRLPQSVTDLIDGTLHGNLTAHIGLRASPSMLDQENFHRLALHGNLTVDNLYWLSGDTVNMVNVDRVTFDFGTAQQFRYRTVHADSLLHVELRAGKGDLLHDDIAMDFEGFKIELSTENKSTTARPGNVKSMGGKIDLGAFNMTLLTDSSTCRVRRASGYAVIHPYKGSLRNPEFIVDLSCDRVSAGGNSQRVVMRRANTHLQAHFEGQGRKGRNIAHLTDSLHRIHPDIPMDRIYGMALKIHNEHANHSPYPRVHPLYEDTDSTEVIDWGASTMFKRILEQVAFNGWLKSERAGFFTPYFPMRNRIRNIDIAFNNDSVTINRLQYKVGHSDFTVNGVVSNLRRALTSQNLSRPLRARFDVTSDTIDINQLTEITMAGSAYAAHEDSHPALNLNDLDRDETLMEKAIASRVQEAPDTVMPLLIPTNLDAELTLRAANVRYSDIPLRDMTGHILLYDGAVNLNNLKASSPGVGNLDLSALYQGHDPESLRFGLGLTLTDFNLERFLGIMPAVDSIMPVLRDFSGIIGADIAATVDVDKRMDLKMSTLDAAIRLTGDSLVLLDPATFRKLSRWLMFKDKQKNIIQHMDVSMTVRDNTVQVYPFIFDFDRYRLGVQGYNDFGMHYKYHIAVLKSPIPFKFGINISGTPDKMKIRLGGAKFGEKQIRQVAIVDTTRINLMNEIQNVFRRGARNARLQSVRQAAPLAADIDLSQDTLTAADSLRYIQQGLIDAPPPPPAPVDKPTVRKSRKSKNKHSPAPSTPAAAVDDRRATLPRQQ